MFLLLHSTLTQNFCSFLGKNLKLEGILGTWQQQSRGFVLFCSFSDWSTPWVPGPGMGPATLGCMGQWSNLLATLVRAVEHFLNLFLCQHANRQSNQIAKSKPMDDIHNETRGHSIPVWQIFCRQVCKEYFHSRMCLLLLPSRCGIFFFTLYLGWL